MSNGVTHQWSKSNESGGTGGGMEGLGKVRITDHAHYHCSTRFSSLFFPARPRSRVLWPIAHL